MAFIVSLAYLKAIKKNGAAQQSGTRAIHWQMAAECNILEYSNMQWNTVEVCNTLEYSILVERSGIHWNAVESCGIYWNTVSAQQSSFGRCL